MDTIYKVLCKDTIYLICQYLDDVNKIYFLSLSKQLYKFRLQMKYDQTHVLTDKIIKLPYYKNFRNFIITSTYHLLKIHNNIRSITFGRNFNENIIDIMPGSFDRRVHNDEIITHLTFGNKFNQDVTQCIPLTVTHLTFGENFNQPIDYCIPLSVTHLIFGRNFDKPINYCIPPSVTHLILGQNFDQEILWDSISSSITHLTFGRKFNRYTNHDLKLLPPTVSHLVIYTCGGIINIIPSTVTNLILINNYDIQTIKNIMHNRLKFVKQIFYAQYNPNYAQNYSPKTLAKIN